MENNQKHILKKQKSNENLETPNEQIQQNEKTFSPRRSISNDKRPSS